MTYRPETRAVRYLDGHTGGVVLDEDRGIVAVPVTWLVDIMDPMATPPWGEASWAPITTDEVLGCDLDARHPEFCKVGHARVRTIVGQPLPDDTRLAFMECRACEVFRIAFLARHGWPPAADDPEPVLVDVGLGNYMPTWPILDGNHRLAAAMVRGDTHLEVSVQGDWDRGLLVLVEGVTLSDAVDVTG